MLGWIDTLLQGVLLGGLYSLYATGLSVIFGIMRLVNLAHGDLIVLGAFLMLAAAAAGVPIVLALVLVVPLMFLAGYALQSVLLNRALGRNILPPLLITFGL
jgi:branched-chain amino acid transport system permease protein